MTTVAWDGRFFASDTQGDHGGLIVPTKKLMATPDYVIGGAGSYALIYDFWRRTKDMSLGSILDAGFGVTPDSEDDDDLPSIMIASRKSRNAWYMSGRVFVPIERGFHAIGSGRDFALAAMSLGKTAYEAVELARTLDVSTGGAIDLIELQC